jgi:3-oxoacyl-[acyl-carrier protein] reductase
MFMSVVAHQSVASIHPELAGGRVLITGLTSASGVDIARAFAEHKARLVIQAPESSPEMTALATVLAESAAEIKLLNEPFASPDVATRFVQGAAQDLGGLDAVVNLISLAPSDVARNADLADVEAYVSHKLLPALLMTRVAANRMRLTWTEGTILNVTASTGPAGRRAAMVADVMQATLAAMTRGEAREWAEHGIRINAAGPCGPGRGLASSADVAALALHLASRKGKGLTGHVFDAAGIATRCC